MAANDNLYIPFGQWDEADKKEAGLLPAGDYVLKVVDVEVTKIKTGPNEGTPGIVVWYKAVDAPAGLEDIYIVDRFYTMKSTLWRFAGFLRAVGLKVTQNDMSLPYKKLLGRKVTATLEDGEPFKNKVKSEVASYAPVPKTAPMQGSGLTEDTSFVEDVATKAVDPAVADAMLNGGGSGYTVEDPWAMDESISL